MMPDKPPLQLYRFDARMEALEAVLAHVEAQADGIPSETVLRAQTALEELFTNCVLHGGPNPLHKKDKGGAQPGENEQCIWLGVQCQGPQLHLQLEDPFAEFDPFQQVSQESSFGYLPVEDRPVGGLGVLMVARLADAVRYTRTSGRNCVSLYFAPRN